MFVVVVIVFLFDWMSLYWWFICWMKVDRMIWKLWFGLIIKMCKLFWLVLCIMNGMVEFVFVIFVIKLEGVDWELSILKRVCFLRGLEICFESWNIGWGVNWCVWLLFDNRMVFWLFWFLVMDWMRFFKILRLLLVKFLLIMI